MEISIPTNYFLERNQTFEVTSTGCPGDRKEEELFSDRGRHGPVTSASSFTVNESSDTGTTDGATLESMRKTGASWSYGKSSCKRKDHDFVQSRGEPIRESMLCCQSFQGISWAAQRELLRTEVLQRCSLSFLMQRLKAVKDMGV